MSARVRNTCLLLTKGFYASCRDQRKSQEARTLELRDINAKLSDKLRDLKEEQSTLLNELEDAKQDKNTVHARLVSIMQGMEG